MPRTQRYRQTKGSCSQCGKRNVKVWLYPFLGSIKARICAPCLVEHVGVDKLRQLVRFDFISINLPPENPTDQLVMFGNETER
jgi:hypothetical protein